MFGEYSIGDLGSIFVMQGFAGLILFSVYVLMALGLAIIFGQMGVINMAHGEFLTIGAYTTYLLSVVSQKWAPWLHKTYFVIAGTAVASLAAGGAGGYFLAKKHFDQSFEELLEAELEATRRHYGATHRRPPARRGRV